ncbi:MAG: tetratricopeptide repeat protein [Anaerolineae bacterium]
MFAQLFPDPFVRRLTLAGCGLMALAPVALLVAGVFFGWNLLLNTLPRGYGPVRPAGEYETMALVTRVPGVVALDNHLVDAVGSSQPSYTSAYSSIKVERLRRTVTTAAQAEALLAEYNASLIVWDGGDTVMITTREPINEVLPATIPFDPALPEATADHAAAMVYLFSRDLWAAEFAAPQEDTLTAILLRTEALRRMGRNLNEALAELTAPGLDDPAVYVMEAILLQELGAFDDALAATQQAIQLAPDSPLGYIQQGRVHIIRAEIDEALADFDTALTLDPTALDALRGRAEAYTATYDLRAALQALDAAVAVDHTDAELYLWRGRTRADLGDLEGARAAFDMALDLANRSDLRAAILEARARANLQHEQYGAALDDYEALIDQVPDNEVYIARRGMVYWLQGDHDVARGIWEGGLASLDAAGLASSYNNRAWFLALEGIYEPALEYANISLSYDPVSPHTLHTRGYIYLETGRYAEAIGDFEDSLNYGIRHDPIYRDLGDAFFGLGQYADAIVFYEEYLTRTGYPPDLLTIRQRINEAQAALD